MPLPARGRTIASAYTGPGLITMRPKPVKRIGRDSARCYCSRCGSKRTVCRCEDAK